LSLVIDDRGCEPAVHSKMVNGMAITLDAPPAQEVPFPNGTAVFDDAFPGQRANVIAGGQEQSDVIFDGGVVRCRPNDCLHKVGEEQADAVPAVEIDTPARAETAEALAARIRAAHRDLQIAGLDLVRKAIAIGEDLIKLQLQIEEGRWVRYLDQHCGFSRSMAYNYIALAKNRPAIEAYFQRVGNGLSLRGALALITKKPSSAPTDSDDADSDVGDSAESDVEPDVEPDVEDDVEPDGLPGPQSPLRDYWPTATAQERRDLFGAMSLDELLAVLPMHLRRGLTERLADLNGSRRSTKLTRLIKTAVKTRSPAEQITALAKFKDALDKGDDFEVRVRASK
jgi:hypothetical protein